MKTGRKDDKGTGYMQIPREGLDALARQYALGGVKYYGEEEGPYNYRLGYAWSLSYEALQRHATAWADGETYDPESGQPHMAAVAWHALNLIYMEAHYPEHDDRWVGFPAFEESALSRRVRDAIFGDPDRKWIPDMDWGGKDEG